MNRFNALAGVLDGGNMELTPNEVVQFGLPMHTMDISARNANLLDFGMQRVIEDEDLARQAATDREGILSPDDAHLRLSRHSRLMELRRNLPAIEVLANPQSTQLVAVSAGSNVNIDVPSGSLLCRLTSVNGKSIGNFQGNIALPSGGNITDGGGFIIPIIGRLFFVDSVKQLTTFAVSDDYVSAEFWGEAV